MSTHCQNVDQTEERAASRERQSGETIVQGVNATDMDTDVSLLIDYLDYWRKAGSHLHYLNFRRILVRQERRRSTEKRVQTLARSQKRKVSTPRHKKRGKQTTLMVGTQQLLSS